MEGFLFFLVVIVALVAAIFLLPWRMRIVPEEERLVIYRLGKFNRIVGPGVVRMSQFSKRAPHV